MADEVTDVINPEAEQSAIATQIARLSTARNTIRTKLVDLELAESTAKLDTLATAIDGIANNGTVTTEVREGESYTIQPGYYKGGTVAGVAGGGNYTLQEKSVTPTKSAQNVTSDEGYYGLSAVNVAAIPEAYQDVTSVNAVATEVLVGKTIVTADGTVVIGTMPNIGSYTETIDHKSTPCYIPEGYHDGTGSVSVVTETKTATPTKAEQTIIPTNGKVLSKVTVAAIPDEYQDVTGVTATADKVLTGSTFVDSTGAEVDGTMANNGAINATLDTTTTSKTIPAGYTTGGTVNIVTETKSATPTKASQTISATSGKVLSSVTVAPIPKAYADISNVTATGEDVLSGCIFVEDTGTESRGSMTNNGAVTATIDGLSTTKYTIPKGFHNGSGTVSLTSDIEDALAAI